MVEQKKCDQLQQEEQQQKSEQFRDSAALAPVVVCSGRDNVLVGECGEGVSTNGGRRVGGSYSLAAVAVAVYLGVIFASASVHGASLNGSLEGDLRSNSSNNEGDLVGSTSLPPYTSNDTSEGSKSNHKRTIEHSSHLGENEHFHRINFTVPLNNFEKSPIIVKHGDVVYEVSENGTISSNVGAISIPIITASQTQEARLGIFEKMTATVIGLRVEQSAKGVSYENGASKILANSQATVRFFGRGFTSHTMIRFVTEEEGRGVNCDDLTSTKYFHFESSDVSEYSALAKITLPPLNEDEKLFYVCVKEENAVMPWVHQGGEPWIILTSYQKWLPLWAHIIILVFLLTLSGLFSGLNLGLMSLDKTDLKIIMNTGSNSEKQYAKSIAPVRNHGNFLLCALLLGNVLVNALLTILLDDITSGLVAVIGSTVGIVIFGEIVPQAVCSRYGLAIGAKTVWITKFFMAATFPLSYPISVILDKVLGEEIGNVYNRERLKELIRVTQGENDLEKQEMNIISGALDLKQKTVADVMTKLDEVYMLPIDAILDFDTVSEIMSNGYSRIPVYENYKGNVVSLLYAKDLAFVDPDDRMPLRTICEFYSNPCHFVFENMTLNLLFNVFKQGKQGHMAFVKKVMSSDKDPIYETCGIVTLEDIIEELIQEEINDETDVWETKERRSDGNYNANIILADGAMTRVKTEGTTVSPQLTLAAFQYLSTAVEEFNDMRISKTVLERLLKQNIYYQLKLKNKEKTDPSTILYERGKPADYFIMILEGRVHVEIGRESLLFESGPFTFFGTNSLSPNLADAMVSSTPLAMRKISQASFSESAMQPNFIPDYTVRAVTDLTYLAISYSVYLAAKQATALEKTYIPPEENTDQPPSAVKSPPPLSAKSSISDVTLKRQLRAGNEHPLFRQDSVISISENNNVSPAITKPDEFSDGRGNLQNQENGFIPGTIAEGDEKNYSKL